MISNIIIVAVIATIFGLCLRKTLKGMKGGDCSGCGGNCAGCGMACHSKTDSIKK